MLILLNLDDDVSNTSLINGIFFGAILFFFSHS